MKKVNFLRVCIVVFGMIFVVSVITYAKTTQKNIAQKLLRLHIVANSDSEADQKLKLKVRDRLIEEGVDIFEKNISIAEARRFVNENKNRIREIAEEEVRKNGYSYTVSVEIGEFSFPAKIYDNIMLPSGRYNAVRLIIGEGKGENWWCVMYPPMCSLENLTVEKGKSQLKKSLSGEEYRIISKENPPAEIRFKIVDIINSLF